MDVELTNIHKLDGSDTGPPRTYDTNISMTAASNPAYVPDGEELRHRKVRVLCYFDLYFYGCLFTSYSLFIDIGK